MANLSGEIERLTAELAQEKATRYLHIDIDLYILPCVSAWIMILFWYLSFEKNKKISKILHIPF